MGLVLAVARVLKGFRFKMCKEIPGYINPIYGGFY